MPSSDLNSVILVGRLTRDAELTYLQSGTAVAAISIAVNRSRREGEQWVNEANFFDVSYFGKPAEALKPYLTKGKQIAVQGALKQDRWEKDGQKFSRIRIMATNIELLGGRSDNGGAGYGNASSGGYQNAQSGYVPRQSSSQFSNNNQFQGNNSFGGYDSMPEDSFGGDGADFPEDIPF